MTTTTPQEQGLDESQWFGKGAESLGLQGKVEMQDFFEALNGRFAGQELGRLVKNPATGEPEREHRPGTDLTFSAPKSVSILAEVYGSGEVRRAHEQAVEAALGYVEREFSFTRKMENGELTTERTGNLTVALFRHNTSRDLDPQTHTHAIVMNATKREDGQWRSLTNDEIFKAQRVIGAVYNATLAEKLQDLGYELRRIDDRGNFEIAGITREQIEHFSQRRAGMEAAMAERGIDIHTATSAEKEAVALATRARKTDVDHEELIADWKGRAAAVGIDGQAIEQEAAAHRGRGGVVREDRLTGRAALEFAAAHLIEREAVVSKNDLMKTALEHGAGRVSPVAVEKAFERLERDGHLVQLPDGNYSTRKMVGSETWALAQISDTKGARRARPERAGRAAAPGGHPEPPGVRLHRGPARGDHQGADDARPLHRRAGPGRHRQDDDAQGNARDGRGRRLEGPGHGADRRGQQGAWRARPASRRTPWRCSRSRSGTCRKAWNSPPGMRRTSTARRNCGWSTKARSWRSARWPSSMPWPTRPGRRWSTSATPCSCRASRPASRSRWPSVTAWTLPA